VHYVTLYLRMNVIRETTNFSGAEGAKRLLKLSGKRTMTGRTSELCLGIYRAIAACFVGGFLFLETLIHAFADLVALDVFSGIVPKNLAP